MKKFLISILLFFGIAFLSLAEGKHGFNHYNVENGMSHINVEAIIQDSFGFLWFGTGKGLDKFDGNSFKVYGNDNITSLLEGPDNVIWVGTTSGLYRFNPFSEISERFGTRTPEGISISGEVTCLKADADGILWIGTLQEGLFRFNLNDNRLSRISVLDNNGSSPRIFDILPESHGVVFLATSQGLIRYEIRWNRCTVFPIPNVNRQEITCLEKQDHDSILVGSKDDGIFIFDKNKLNFSPFLWKNGRLPNPLAMLKTGKDEVWIGNDSGLYIFNEKNLSLDHFVQNHNERTSISNNAIRSLLEDREGGVWIGTYLGGVNYTSTEQNFITQFTPTNSPDALHGMVIRDFVEDENGAVWIGTEDNGLYRYDKESGKFDQWSPENGKIPWHNISALMLDGDDLYIGMQKYGVCKMDVQNGRITNPKSYESFPENIFTIFKESNGTILVGIKEGLRQLDPTDLSLSETAMNPGITVFDMTEDHQKVLWFATAGDGLCSYDPRSGVWNRFHKGDDGNTLSSDNTISITENSQGNIWIGTEDSGACLLDPSTEEFKRFDMGSGLPSNTVYKVIEDKEGNIWFTTSKGLTRMSASTGSCITYSYNYGAPANQFNYKSGMKSRDGKLYFGTVHGFMEISPDDLHTNYDPPKVVFTGWSIPEGEYSLDPVETIVPGLKFKHTQTNISFRFAALSYTAPQNNKYAYRLRGLDKDWTYTNNTFIHYSRIPSGKYFLELKGANGDGVWNQTPTSIRIVVQPPFFKSWIGILMEIVSVISVIVWVFLTQRKRMFLENSREIERIREMEAAATQKSRIDFFTSIIHEIRTPLSLIKAPFEQIKNNDLSEEEKREDMNMIEVNINRLMLLANEILDFSRIEGNAFKLRPRLVNVTSVVMDVIRSFSFTIQGRGLSIENNFPGKDIYFMADAEIIIKILTNLLANATKYAEKRIVVKMEEDEGGIIFRISNDGPLVSKEGRERVFVAFYREDREKNITGTGLGLPLVKKLTELHKGSIHFDDNDDTMNTLIVKIPSLEDSENDSVDMEPSAMISEPDTNKRTIAIVDDDPYFRQYFKRTLSVYYNIMCCSGASDLFEVLRDNMVDLVISDIMMPDVDGIQLCHILKSSLEYSQIPVIMLSAKIDSDAKMQSMTAEADAFIEKPFTLDYIRTQIESIFYRLEKMRDYYTKQPGTEGSSLPGNPSDQAFMERISVIISEHMSEEDFSIDKIADILGMSRSTLYRKIRGLIQIPPGELIKIVRLKKAAQMLRSGTYRVNEVGFLVGFNSVSYFSTCFHKQFGQSPKEYMSNNV